MYEDAFGFSVIAIILIVVTFFIFNKGRNLQFPVKSGNLDVNISNKGHLPYTLKFESGNEIVLEPEDQIASTISMYETISAYGQHGDDNSSISHEYPVVDSNVRNLYITPDGFKSGNTASDIVILENQSDIPVRFVHESSKGKRRWEIITLQPRTRATHQFVGSKSTIQVTPATEDEIIIDKVFVSGIPSKIIFDGVSVKAQ
ncbi:hypothetical protein OAG24_00535 [bacterium]|nr:hypothetical protein [bacterium]